MPLLIKDFDDNDEEDLEEEKKVANSIQLLLTLFSLFRLTFF